VGQGITWYGILGVLPGASPGEIQEAYDAKAGVLRPELIAGAPSNVVAAASRAQGLLDAAGRVLGEPASRQRYDEAAGLSRSGGGLVRPEDVPSEPGWGPSDFDLPGGPLEAELLGGLMMLADWLAPKPRRPGHLPVPDVRGLFYSVCLDLVGNLDLRVTAVRLTEHPMPVDGLVVGQSPLPPAKIRREGELTIQVWHPSAQSPGAA
jgi:hypothetical protein